MRILSIVSIVFCLVLGGASLVSAVDFPGPDDFGYTGVVMDPGDPGNQGLRNIHTSPSPLNSISDDGYIGIDLPFPFNFYGDEYSKVCVSGNGFIAFTNDTCRIVEISWVSQEVPFENDDNNIIAGLWVDLNARQGGTITHGTLGTEGVREFVVGFYAVPHFGGSNQVTFEIILHEGSNRIELQYGSLATNNNDHSVGIENGDGTDGIQIAFGTDMSLVEGKGFLLDPPNQAVEVPINIRPRACPNNNLWLDRWSWFHRKRLRVAISGSKFPIDDIDVSTLTMEGVAPTKYYIKDVYMRERLTHNGTNGNHFDFCTDKYRDGIEDLVLIFDKVEIIEAMETNKPELLEAVNTNNPELNSNGGGATTCNLEGKLKDGTDIFGEDLVVIRKWQRKWHKK